MVALATIKKPTKTTTAMALTNTSHIRIGYALNAKRIRS